MTTSWPPSQTNVIRGRPPFRKHITNCSKSAWDRAQPLLPLQLKEPSHAQSTPSVAMISRMRKNLCDFCSIGCMMSSIGSPPNPSTKNWNTTSYPRRSKVLSGLTTTNKEMTLFSPTSFKASSLIAPNVSAVATKTSPLTTSWIWA